MSRIGLPVCWEPARVSDAITLTAKVGQEQRDHFLATHAPVTGLVGRKGFHAATLTEAALYERLMEDWKHRRPGADLSVLIHGEAGSGKSHLINWLKLRCDHDRPSGAHVVLVRRRSGSLKDALTQLVEQLGERFADYLQPVRDALGKLSHQAAVRQLLLELSQELGPRRESRGKESLRKVAKNLRYLDAACATVNGFGAWLERKDGALDRNIRLLIEGGEIEQRESRPRFIDEDVGPQGEFKHRVKNPGDVFDLIEELEESPALRSTAVGLLNESLDLALAAMTGLSGDNLDSIFAKIRRDLKKSGERLVLLVEDVSALSVLDVEIVKAVEPKGDSALCPLLAVLGVTEAGFERLRENDRDRITHIAQLSGGAWADDPARLAGFTARYLNAARLSTEQVVQAASVRLAGHDISVSACENCPDREACHGAFGAVAFGGIDVGMYPLTKHAPALMLQRMREDKEAGIRPNPRGYLMHLLGPLLGDAESLRQHRFPGDAAIRHLEPDDPPRWADFANRFLGGYDDEQKERTRRLLMYWLPASPSADDAAASLEPLRPILGLPSFSRAVKKKLQEEQKSDAPPRKEKTATGGKESPKHAKLRQGLRAWIEGGVLADDVDSRRWLAELARRSIPWQDLRIIPRSEYDRWFKKQQEDSESYRSIKIEGQKSQPPFARNLPDQFPRDERTRELIDALASFDWKGNGTWDFQEGELKKRTVSRWLRANSRALAEKFRPPVDAGKAASGAAALLALVATVRRRARLSESPGEALAEVLRPLEVDARVLRFDVEKSSWADIADKEKKAHAETPPILALSKPWHDLIEDLRIRHSELLDFLRKELDVPQGDTGGTNFIDPGPILETVAEARDKASAPTLDARLMEKNAFWATRFAAVGRLENYSALAEALEAERACVAAVAERCLERLGNLGYDRNAPREALALMAEELAAMEWERKKAKFFVPDERYEALVKGKSVEKRGGGWAGALEKAAGLASDLDTACFDPRPLLELDFVLGVVAGFAEHLGTELDEQDEQLRTEGDPDAAKAGLLGALDELAGEGSDVTASGVEGPAGEPAGSEAVGDAAELADGLPAEAR